MSAASPPPFQTFRDPDGALCIENGRVIRMVYPQSGEAGLQFLGSNFARKNIDAGRLIPTQLLERKADGGLLLEHPRVFFPSYPWEWTPGQWIAAAELTLDLCEQALDEGLILKDATPLNILFHNAQPVLVDVLSFEKHDPGSPLWMAYGQFVRTFLLPLAACKYLGWPLSASLQKRDGYEPADIYPYLSAAQRWTCPFRSLVTLPCLLDRRKGASATAASSRLRQLPEIAAAVLRRNLRGLGKLVRSLQPATQSSRWSAYPQTADHYDPAAHEQKQAFVRRALAAAKPRHVLDLGANTGVYSRLAAESGANVVAWDTDLQASEQNWRVAQEKELPIQPLIVDPARPTPAVGWRNRESLSLLERAAGRFDCVMMLGLIHHILLTDQIPLHEIAALTRDLTRRWAIVEWVPATDPRFADLCRGRDAIYGGLDEAAFAEVFRAHFSCTVREQLPNGRVLFLFEAR